VSAPRRAAQRGLAQASARSTDPRIDPGAAEHYADPAYYALAYRTRTEDVDYYVQRLGERPGARVLEYGAGNGRITLALARAGCEVTALDASAPMLADLSARLEQESPDVQRRVRVVLGDMRERIFRAQFDWVIAPFNTLLHLYSVADAERFLRRVAKHLAPRGRFLFDFSLPRVADLAVDPNRWFRGPRFRHPSNGELVAYAERFHYAQATQVLSTWMRFTPIQGGPVWETRLTHRQYFPQEIAALLHYNGFRDAIWSADFGEAPLCSTSDTAVVECRVSTAAPTTKRRLRP
jgi:SAM-dependent methyltransferase